jgi:response regulator RpfG family c-di-GMP phosphodiesterase
VREELANPFVRIVLRTGQAGQAPEHEVIAAYDINDYKEKTELTAERLATTMYAALRAYRDMRTIESQRLGLENVVRASAQMFARQSTHELEQTVLEQLVQLVPVARGGLLGTATADRDGQAAPIRVVAATGDYNSLVGTDADGRLPAHLLASLHQACANRRHHFARDHYVLHFSDTSQSRSLLFAGDGCELSRHRRQLIELFCANVTIAFENRHLNNELLSSQLEMVYLLAGAAETRSQETENHVHRVGLLAEMLGQAMGLDPAFCVTLRYSAPLHDIGKIGIPDTILNKPGAHDAEEMQIMRTHAELGARLLGSSQRPVLQLAAEIAASHHENWDGSGYPLGLAGEAIPIGGRITMVADVFDALGSRRCYKEPWSAERIRRFMQEQRGGKFDPSVVDRLFERWEQAMALREGLPD